MSDGPTEFQNSFERAEAISRKGRLLIRGRKTGLITGLCDSCHNGLVFAHGTKEHSEIQVFCTVTSARGKSMPPDVIECSMYWDRSQPGLEDMGREARLIDVREGPPQGSAYL